MASREFNGSRAETDEEMSDSPDVPRAPRTMLIVDDQQSVRVSLAFLLGNEGYNIVTAASGEAALAIMDQQAIEAAIIDVHMPIMNGFDSCIRLQAKAHACGRALRVWFMTGASTRLIERRGVELGSFAVLQKPFDFPALMAQLEAGFSSPVPTPSIPEISGPDSEKRLAS